jgi:hypothetical protein
LDVRYVGPLVQQPLPEKKAHCQFSVITRRAHRHGYRSDRSQAIALLPDLDLQWIFYRNVIAGAVRPDAVYPANPNERNVGGSWHSSLVKSTPGNTHHNKRTNKVNAVSRNNYTVRYKLLSIYYT